MNVLLGVSGGIAAYKACELVRAFKKRGDQVRVIMTSGAQEFVRPLTLQILSENPVGTEVFDATFEHEIGHIDLARWADVALLAPATANLIGRLAAGLADDLLTTVLLATSAPVVVAPAMNTQMWRHPLLQRNLDVLRDEAGYLIVDPDAGELACKEVGPGRLPDPPVLLAMLDRATRAQTLAGKKVLVTAGPTREHLDPARFISNPSSGRMGYALARAAAALGAEVTLISGPTELTPPMGARLVDVTSAAQMHRAVMAEADRCDFVCKAAAVCDFRPATASQTKVEKAAIETTLELKQNPDILAELGAARSAGGDGPFLIGFAAESHDVIERATKKRERKGAHMIVANEIGGPQSSFGAQTSTIAVISEDDVREFGPADKEQLAFDVWEVAAELASRPGKKRSD
jgi:phosphopantothenoylcysteine decarboxylase / phosphopantothenate---cysteine ligase